MMTADGLQRAAGKDALVLAERVARLEALLSRVLDEDDRGMGSDGLSVELHTAIHGILGEERIR